jgi:hypothetical protein
LISAAPFRDRVLHHALCRVVEPIFDRTFIHDSYACRVGKGNHRAVERCSQFARRHAYVLKCDIVKFFPSIDQAILRDLLARRIADAQTLWLIDLILASGAGVLEREYTMHYFPGDDLFAACRPRGLPIGNLTSARTAITTHRTTSTTTGVGVGCVSNPSWDEVPGLKEQSPLEEGSPTG